MLKTFCHPQALHNVYTCEWLKKGIYKFFVDFTDKCSTDKINSRVNSGDNRAQLNAVGNQR